MRTRLSRRCKKNAIDLKGIGFLLRLGRKLTEPSELFVQCVSEANGSCPGKDSGPLSGAEVVIFAQKKTKNR